MKPEGQQAKSPVVFVIEDDDVQRRGLSRFLTREGFRVREFPDGEAAIKGAAERGEVPDLVVCDYRLPGKNGLEVMKELGGKGTDTACILISAYLTEELGTEARTAGFSRILEKPVNLSVLLHECRSAIACDQ